MHAQNRTAPRRAVHAYAYRRSMVLERRARAHWPHWHGRRRRFPQRVRYRTIGGNARRARGSRKPRTGTGTGTGRLSRSLNGARRKTLDTGHRTQDARHRTQDTGHRTQDTEAPASHRIAGQRKAYPAFRHGGRAQAVVEPKPSDVCMSTNANANVDAGRGSTEGERRAEWPRLPAAVAGADAGCLGLGTSPFRTRTNGRRASRHGMGR